MSLISRLEKLEHDCPEMLDRVRELLANHGSNTAETVAIRMADVERSLSERMGAMERKMVALIEEIGVTLPEPSPPSEPDAASAPRLTAAEITSDPSWILGAQRTPEPDNSDLEASAPAA